MSGFTPLIAAHATTAAVSLLLGGFQLLRPVKGDALHRRIGWLWVAAMTFVATSSFAIRELRHGQLSLLHVLSVVTLVSMVLGVARARGGNVTGHRAAMRGSWLGLVAAFVGAVAVPDRRIPTFAVAHPIGLVLATAAVVAITVALIWVAKLTFHSDRSGTVRDAGASATVR